MVPQSFTNKVHSASKHLGIIQGYENADSSSTVTNISFYSHYSTEVKAFEIRDNTQLSFIDLTTITSANTIDIGRNGPSATVLQPNMTMGYNVSLSNIVNVDLRALTSLDFGNFIL